MKPSSNKHKAKGLSLERFAGAKQSSYDKKAKQAKEMALNAKKINKYRKLKQRLASKGLLGPKFAYDSQVSSISWQPARNCASLQRLDSHSRAHRKMLSLLLGILRAESPEWTKSKPGTSLCCL